MANILKNQLYPHIKQYINEYLHGFSEEKIDIQLSKGEVTLEKMSLRPDTINKIMDENNVPFWIKVGLIKKISLGASVLSVIGEIPIEVEIDGVDIILSPSYKWIINNLLNYGNNEEIKDILNPLGNDIFNKKVDDLDLSIFNVENIQEIFRDKTLLSNIINKLFKSLYSFYNSPNFTAVIKIKNVHIRFEDDELMNYTGDIALGMKVNLIQLKIGCKGNMKKNSIKLENLDIYWENEAKILISSNFLNGCIVNGQLQEKYYTNLKNVRFEKFQYMPFTKFIIQDFNFTMNLGTRNENKEKIDIFDIKSTPSMVYLQLASNELNINIFPEIVHIQNNFLEFLAQFPIIEKVKDYKPFIKPSENNSLKYIDLVENYRKNVIDNNNKNKLLVRDWINYVYWFQKSKRGDRQILINPVRTEFARFYNICIKKIDVHKILKEKKAQENKGDKKEDIKEDKKEYKKEYKKEIRNEFKKEDKKKHNLEGPKDREVKNGKETFINNLTPMGDEKENVFITPGQTPNGETPTPGEDIEEEKIEDLNIIPPEFDFSSRIDLLIKGVNINLNSPLNSKKNDYISLSIGGIEIKIRLSKEKFDFNFKIKTIDLGPSNLNIGQRVIIQPKSYRKAIPEQNMTSLNSNIPYGNLTTYNYVSVPNSDLGSRITGLIKKYNPKHEEKIKKIDEALELAQSNSRLVSLAPSELGDYNKLRGEKKLRNKTPFGEISEGNLGQSALNINLNMTDLGKTYGSVFVPRNVSFAKNLIDNYEGNSLQNKKYERKKNKELNISQAINDYNSYKNQEKNRFRSTRSPQPITSSLSSSNFNLRESQFGINPFGPKGRNVPLNLLEIFSNTEVGALSLTFTKFNNPVTIDNLSIQIGTIRLNMFVNYLLDILRILSEYKKATNTPKITTSQGDFSPDGQSILELQEYFYNYLLKKIPDSEKTESMNEYMEYLRKEIISKKKFSSKPEHFALNQVFSFFPKGFDFHFDYENIEIVAYDKDNVVSSKIIIPSNEFLLSLSFTKIFVKLLDLEIEISDLNKCETIIEQLKDLAKDKFKVVEIVIEPCYKQIKYGIEPLLKDNSVEYKQILKNQKINNNQNPPPTENIDQEENDEEKLEIKSLLNKENTKPQDILLSQKPKEVQQQQEFLRRQKENQLLIQKQKEQQELIRKQKEQQELIRKQKEQQELIRKQKEQQLLIQKQKEEEKKLLLFKQNQEKEKIQQMQLQKLKEALIKQQQLANQQKLLILSQKHQQKELSNQNQKIPQIKQNPNIPQINQNQNIPQINQNQNIQQINANQDISQIKPNQIIQQINANQDILQINQNPNVININPIQNVQQMNQNPKQKFIKINPNPNQKIQGINRNNLKSPQPKLPEKLKLPHQNLSQNQLQQQQELLLRQQQNFKHNSFSNTKNAAPLANSLKKIPQIPKLIENEEKGEKVATDSIRANKRSNNENNNSNIIHNNINYFNEPKIKMQRQHSSSGLLKKNMSVNNYNINPYYPQNIRYNIGEIQNNYLNNTNYNNVMPRSNSGYINYFNNQQNSYIIRDNSSQINENSSNAGFSLFNNTGYA